VTYYFSQPAPPPMSHIHIFVNSLLPSKRRAHTTPLPQKEKRTWLSNFASFHFCPILFWKWFQIKIEQKRKRTNLKEMSVFRGGWWPNEAALRVFRVPASPTTRWSWIFNADMLASFSFSCFVLLIITPNRKKRVDRWAVIRRNC
jgi:hypothetical protein